MTALMNLSDGEDAPAADRSTLVTNAYRALRRDIIDGKLRPGSKLRVEHLKDDYNVGASTLREALALLASDALVTSQGQRGFRVAPITISDFYDITETRILLETNAIKQSMRRGGDEWEGALTAAFHILGLAEQRLDDTKPETLNAWEIANKRFHHALIGECESPWTLHFLAILFNQAERYRRLLLSNRPVTRNVHDEHRAIYEAAMSGDEAVLSEVLAKHIRYNYLLLEKLSPQAIAHAGAE